MNLGGKNGVIKRSSLKTGKNSPVRFLLRTREFNLFIVYLSDEFFRTDIFNETLNF